MKGKAISHVQGKGSIAHNNRLFSPKNVDPNRTVDNVCYIHKPIAEAYSEIFDEAVSEYNSKQKRSDRMIRTGYYEHLFKRSPCNTVIEAANGQKSFYEDVVQVGTKDDTGVGSADAEIAKICLDEYMRGFQKRNPNFYVFNAVMHLDEATPHLHIDYIPVGHYNRGVPVQNGIAQALKEMGHGVGKDAINRWRQSERKVLKEICLAHGIEISDEIPGRGYSMKCDEYKEHKDKIHAYEEQEKALEAEIQPLLEAKAIADGVSVTGKKMPVGNARLVSESEFEALSAQKKALAVKEENVKAKNAHLDKERFYNDMKEKKLNELSDSLGEREKFLDEREENVRKQEKSADEKLTKAEKLYDKQINLNEENKELTEKVSELNGKLGSNLYLHMELQSAKEQLRGIERKYQRERERELEELSLKHNSELQEKEKAIKSLASDFAEASRELEMTRSENNSLSEKIKSLLETNKYLRGLIETMYEVGRYFAKKLGFDFDDIVDKREDGYSLGYLTGSRGRGR